MCRTTVHPECTKTKATTTRSRCHSETDLFALVDGLDLHSSDIGDDDDDDDDDDYSLSSSSNDSFTLNSHDLSSKQQHQQQQQVTLSTTSTVATVATKKQVSFGHLEERSFPVVAGHPKCFELANPMMLGWDCVSESSFSIDDYEEHRALHRRQSSEDCRTVSPEERRKILKNSKKAFQEFQKQTNKMKKKQNKTRPGIVRRNSMANGMIGRDKRRNRVQDFLERFSNPKKCETLVW